MNPSRVSNDSSRQYDFAIIGAGLAGLWLCKALLENQRTAGKRILLLDRSMKEYAPRTWCFWEKENAELKRIITKSWNRIEWLIGERRLQKDIHPYAYHMIESEKFRVRMFSILSKAPNITRIETTVQHTEIMDADTVRIQTSDGDFEAAIVFDSRWDPGILQSWEGHLLYQQFAGRFIKADQPVFDPHCARLMDFRVPQTGAVAFCYLLPVDDRTALVEYTLFTRSQSPWNELEQGIDDYLTRYFASVPFEESGSEKGVIPMTDFPFPATEGPIIAIGTAGGCTKASSGYTFSFIRRHTRAIIEAVNDNRKIPHAGQLSSPRFRFYDRVLLRILEEKPEIGSQLFFRLFELNPPATVLAFMDNRSRFRDEMTIFSSLPLRIFLRAALKEIFRKTAPPPKRVSAERQRSAASPL